MIRRGLVGLSLLLGLLTPIDAQAITLVNVKDASQVIRSERVLHLVHEIVPEILPVLRKEMAATADKPGDRVVVIHSPGGSVNVGEEIWKMLEREREAGHRIVCVVSQAAYSMAFNILTRCDLRLAVPDAVLMFHRISTIMPPNDDTRLTGPVLRRMAKDLEKTDEPYRQANAKALRMDLREYDLHADNDTIWRAPVLLERGYLHQLVRIAP
jgi:ATP-dependent protease ClpP protease subunit